MSMIRTLSFTLFMIGLVCTVSFPALPEDETTAVSDAPTDYILIVTGSELLSGVYADGHTLFLTRTLGPLGCRCVGSISVGDLRDDLYEALGFAAKKNVPLIIVTGGLGPTDDDITRETISEFMNIPLREHPDALEHMSKRFNRPLNQLRTNLRRQTLAPVKGGYLKNPNGTAVGLIYDDGSRTIIALPGPPRELQPMVTEELIPYLSNKFGIHSIGCSLTMRFVNIGESSIDQTLHEHIDLPKDIILSSLFNLGRVDLTFSLPGDTPADRARLKKLEEELLQYIRPYMYSDNGSSLEEHVIELLQEKGASLVLAEVGSGGSVAASLNSVEGAAKILTGGYVAPSNQAMRLMLSTKEPAVESGEAAVVQIARSACEHSGSDWAIAVTEAQKTENGSRYVWVAVGPKDKGFTTQRMTFSGQGETALSRLVTNILDLLRKQFPTPKTEK